MKYSATIVLTVPLRAVAPPSPGSQIDFTYRYARRELIDFIAAVDRLAALYGYLGAKVEGRVEPLAETC